MASIDGIPRGDTPAIPRTTMGKTSSVDLGFNRPYQRGGSLFDFGYKAEGSGGGKKKGRGKTSNLMETGPDDSAYAQIQEIAQPGSGTYGAQQVSEGLSQGVGNSMGLGASAYGYGSPTANPFGGPNVGEAGSYGFRDKDVTGLVPQMQAEPELAPAQQAAAQATQNNLLMDTGPDDTPMSRAEARNSIGLTETPLQSTGTGFGPTGITGYNQYDASPEQRGAVAEGLGYDYGQSTLPQVAVGALGVMGVPGAGLLSDAVNPGPTDPITVTREDGTTYTDARDRSAGAFGTIDAATGGVWGEDGVAYDPVTGERMPGVFTDWGTAGEHVLSDTGFGEPVEVPETAAEAGLMSIAGNDSIAQVLDQADVATASQASPAEAAALEAQQQADRKAAGQSYVHQDDSGETYNIAAGRSAVTDTSGNVVTSGPKENKKAVTSTNYGGGGSNDNDSGGGGGK